MKGSGTPQSDQVYTVGLALRLSSTGTHSPLYLVRVRVNLL